MKLVLAGLVPAKTSNGAGCKDVDPRDKPGEDEERATGGESA
jgi:hypothetical protein